MQLSPTQVAILCVFIFGGIVGINILARYRSDAEFRSQLSSISASDLLRTREKLIRQENMAPVEDQINEAE